VSDLPAIQRPNGKLYRPRSLRVDYIDNENTWGEEHPFKTVVLGTHDVAVARERAGSGRVCTYLINPCVDWLRLGYHSGELAWVSDDVKGAACVIFDESDDPAVEGGDPTP